MKDMLTLVGDQITAENLSGVVQTCFWTATKVVITKNGDGTYRVEAAFPA